MKHPEIQKTTAIFFLFAISVISSAGYSQDNLPIERMNPPLSNFSPLLQKEIIHYWHFNQLSSEPTIDTVYSDYSFHQLGRISYPGIGDGYMDRVNDGTDINLYPEQTPGYGLRVRNPSDTREMIIEASSEYYENLVLSFATKRTTFGAQDQTLYYSTNNGLNWTAIGDSYTITEDWQLVSFDLTDFFDANNNASMIFKIVFGGLNADATTGNNRFDNISLTGDPIFESLNFFSNETGDLSELSTWGRNFDGSGENPESFELTGGTFHIHNRTQATLDNHWVVTGSGSRVILGDGENQVTLTIPEQYSFTGILNLLDNSTLFLQNDIIPGLGNISSRSTIVFEQSGKVTVPKNSYGKLFVKNGIKSFEGDYIVHSDFEAENTSLEFSNVSQLNAFGNISFYGIIETISPENFNILISGEQNQIVSADSQDYLTAYNFYAEKTTGSLTLATNIYALNNIRLDIRGNAHFSDNSHLLQLYDDLRLQGDNSNNFSLTGTIKLTAESGTNDLEIAFAEMNNLIIDVIGDARPDFLGSGNLIIIKNDLNIKSRSSRSVRFRDKSYHISGDLLIDIETPDQTEEGNSILHLIGNEKQYIKNDGYNGPGLLSNIIINNPSGIEISNGSITVDGYVHFQNGVVYTSENNLMKLGTSGMISTYNESSFVDGPFGIYNTGIQEKNLVFPVGKDGMLRPVVMNLSHDSSQELLFVVEFINNSPQLSPLSSELSEISTMGFYVVENDDPVNLTQGIISLSYHGDDFLKEDLRIAYLLNDSWENLGATFRDDLPGMVTSVGKLNLPGIFALAKWSGIPDNIDDYTVRFNQFNIYPNPASKNSWVNLGETMNVTILNSYGKIILEKEQIDKINLAGFSPGVYFIRNQSGQTTRLVITY
jgi:hypothetical protein